MNVFGFFYTICDFFPFCINDTSISFSNHGVGQFRRHTKNLRLGLGLLLDGLIRDLHSLSLVVARLIGNPSLKEPVSLHLVFHLEADFIIQPCRHMI